MLIKELPGNILYIENLFEEADRFVSNIEKLELNPLSHSVIPPWGDWYDSVPDKDQNGRWITIPDNYSKGKQKLLDWDRSFDYGDSWPRIEPDFDDDAHNLVRDTVDLIHKPYLKALDVWYEKTGNPKLDKVSKNYLLRKYKSGGAIGPHIDKNIENPLNTMDWSVLFYLNDGYEGGDIVFPDFDITISPSAGSALFFPCTTVHEAKEVTSGEKYYIFMVIHSEFKHSTALSEPYHLVNQIILENNGLVDHPVYNLIYKEPKI